MHYKRDAEVVAISVEKYTTGWLQNNATDIKSLYCTDIEYKMINTSVRQIL